MKNAIIKLIGMALIFFGALFLLAWLNSCSVQKIEQKPVFTIEFEDSCYSSESLFNPNPEDHIIAWCDEDYIYFNNFYDSTKLDSVRNRGSELYFVGDFMICKFRY